jgi:flagellar basal-body rod modification protein FlgD
MTPWPDAAADAPRARNWAVPGETNAAGGGRPQPADSGQLATKEVFLQMLVAQIKNQNPLNPMDGVEFLSQLSQFTQVEQTLGMRNDIRQLTGLLERQTAGAAGAAGGAASGARP